MKTKDLEVQIWLLEDPDERVYSIIHDQLVQKGESLIPILEEAWEGSEYSIANQRIESIIHDINLHHILSKMQVFTESGKQNLLDFLLLISKLFYPNLDETRLRSKYQKLKNEVWLELNGNLTGIEKIRVLNHILYKMNGFKNVPPEQNNIKSYLFSEMIISKRGNDYSLGLLYLTLAMDLELPVYGVNLPDSLVLAYVNTDWYQLNHVEELSPLFYISPLNEGAILGIKEIENYFQKKEIQLDPEHFKPISLRRVIRVYLTALRREFERFNDFEKIEEINMISEIFI